MEIGGAVENAFGADIKKRTKAAEQAVIARAQANKWTGDWVPIEVSPTTGAAIPYTKEGETSTATAPAPAIGVEGTPLPANVSGRSAPGERRVSRAAPGAAAATPPPLPTAAPPADSGGGLAGPTAMVEPGVLSAGASKPAGIPNSPNAQAWVGRAVEPKALSHALARLGVQVASDAKTATAATARSDGAIFLSPPLLPTQDSEWLRLGGFKFQPLTYWMLRASLAASCSLVVQSWLSARFTLH